MKNIRSILFITMLAISACSVKTRNNQNTDSTKAAITDQPQKGLFAKMTIEHTIKAGDSVLLKFTVYNTADTAQQFCKLHTPFEPLMSKYLEIKSVTGEEVNYKGAMAKRIMPPPPSSYIKVNGKDSLVVSVDLLKAFDISKPAKYTIIYTGQNMSGLSVTDSVSLVYTKK